MSGERWPYREAPEHIEDVPPDVLAELLEAYVAWSMVLTRVWRKWHAGQGRAAPSEIPLRWLVYALGWCAGRVDAIEGDDLKRLRWRASGFWHVGPGVWWTLAGIGLVLVLLTVTDVLTIDVVRR